MKILVTGGSGFIGQNLYEYLIQKHEVIAPSHAEIELLDSDAVAKFLRGHSFDIIIHGAARPGHRNAIDSSNQVQINTRMFFNLVRNAESYGKFIFLSSGAVYDMGHFYAKMKEEYFDEYVPTDEPGFSKYIIGKYIEKADNILELRLFGVFGKYEDYAIRFISNAICNTIFDLPITIKQNRKFDYLYIDDLMPVIDYFIFNKVSYKSYNVTPDESMELKLLAELVRNISKKELPIMISESGMGMEYSGDNARLRNEIKEISFTNIKDS
ncbi:MAG: NAD-dependent epimerase/dehydratase family protein, partial [Nitrospiria bacterium]